MANSSRKTAHSTVTSVWKRIDEADPADVEMIEQKWAQAGIRQPHYWVAALCVGHGNICMRMNHVEGLGCNRAGAECKYTHKCILCSDSHHGIWDTRDDGTFVCNKHQRYVEEVEAELDVSTTAQDDETVCSTAQDDETTTTSTQDAEKTSTTARDDETVGAPSQGGGIVRSILTSDATTRVPHKQNSVRFQELGMEGDCSDAAKTGKHYLGIFMRV